jgi:glycosyltransferase involved in cell wall biosynthesis
VDAPVKPLSSPRPLPDADIAVLVPCRNEAATVARVVQDFAASLPGCRVYVYDNGSTDQTAALARRAGAIVRREPRPGKGLVVRRMFAEIDADAFVLVDGDATYDASRAPEMVRLLLDNDLDMVTGVRDHSGHRAAYRRGHQLGNRVFNWLLGVLFGARPSDLFSGYRAFSRRFVKSFPGSSRGFEIETDLTVHALEQRLPTGELVTRYVERTSGSLSKLSTVRDGLRIFAKIVILFKDVHPAIFFGGFALAFAVAGLALGIDVIMEFIATRYVARVPTAILATGLMLLAFLAASCGLILDSVARGRRESKRLGYLAAAGVPRAARAQVARDEPTPLLAESGKERAP